MPELPEVETLRRSLEPRLVGRTFVKVDVLETRLRYPLDARRLSRRVRGRSVTAVDRRSKYLLVRLSGQHTLVVHLGMSGRFILCSRQSPVPLHTHVRFVLDGDDDGDDERESELRFCDPRRFGFVDVLSSVELRSDPRFTRLGPEPLSSELTENYFYLASRGSRRPVKNFIMDACVVVGVGNIYASEALFRSGIHPLRAAGRISSRRWAALGEAIDRVLRDAIRAGGTTLNDWQDAQGREGAFQNRLSVYGREGEACPRCGTPVRRKVLAGRSTFYCAKCQR